MLSTNSQRKNNDISIDSVSIETDFIDNSSRRISVSIPPLKTLIDKKDIHLKPYTQEISKNIILDIGSCEIQINKLLRLEDRFKDSYIFFSKISELYNLCGKTLDAIKYAKKALFLKPDSTSLEYKYGEKLLINGDTSSANKVFLKLSEGNYNLATLRLAEYEISNNKIEKSLKLAHNILQNNKYDWKANLLVGTINLVNGKYSKAIKYFRHASYERQNLPSIYLNKGIAYFLLGQYEKSMLEAKKALSINPVSKSALTLLTDVAFISETKLESSKYYIDKYCQFTDITKDIIDKLSNYYYLKESPNEGIKLLDTYKNIFKSPDIWNNLGVFWVKKNHKQATFYFYEAIESVGGFDKVISSRSAELALLNLSGLLLEHHKTDESFSIISQYLKVIEFSKLNDETLSSIYINYVGCLLAKNKVKDALVVLKEIIGSSQTYIKTKIEALSIITTYEILNLNQTSEALDHAIEAYNSVNIEENFDSEIKNMVINNLIFAYLELGDNNNAKLKLEELRYDLKNSNYAYATLGLYNLRVGDYFNGEQNYKKAIGMTIDRTRKLLFKQKLYFELGNFFLSKGDKKKASSSLKKAIKIGKVKGRWEIDSIYKNSKRLMMNI